MQILSALDAVSPAFSRTKLVLFSPYRWGRTWKLGATGYLARAGTLFLPFPLLYLGFLPKLHAQFSAPVVSAIVAAIVLGTFFYLWIFYLCSRIGFAFFDVVLLREQFIAPAWRRHGPAAFKWTALKVLAGTLLSAAFAVPIAHYMQRLFNLMATVSPRHGQPPSPQLLHQMLSFYASFFLVYFVFGIVYFLTSLLGDFVVPSLALEDTTLAEAFRRFGLLFRTEPVQVTVYAIVKLGLGVALYIGGFIALEIGLLIVGLIFLLVIVVLGLLLKLVHLPAAILGILLVLAILVFYAFVLYVFTVAIGAFTTFFEAYNLYFLGGRYPLLGDALDRSTPPPPPPPGYPLGIYPPPTPYLPPQQ